MKKLLLLSTLLLVSLLFVACDDVVPTKPNDDTELDSTVLDSTDDEAPIVSTWVGEESNSYTVNEIIVSDKKEILYNFNSDGNFSNTIEYTEVINGGMDFLPYMSDEAKTQTFTGTWVAENGNLTLEYNSDNDVIDLWIDDLNPTYSYSISGNKLTISDDDSGDFVLTEK